MKIRIGSRKSDLARIQAYQVASALRAADPSTEISFHFKESLGDKNLTDPLWKIPERGVFTEDFLADLREDRVDIVVHSWKDLPTEDRPGVSVVATMPRADLRDMILLRKESFGKENLTILSSSPRRIYSFEKFLSDFLPFKPKQFSFSSVRGNVPTRIRKLLAGEGDMLCLAKAGFDRLLQAPEAELAEMQAALRDALQKTYWSILPLSYFPTAPAQGALAIEIRKHDGDAKLRKLLEKIHCAATFQAVQEERRRFSAFGGGCHQKIGLTIAPHNSLGNISYFSGKLDNGDEKHEICVGIAPKRDTPRWPLEPTGLFTRRELSVENPGTPLFVARANALPSSWKVPPEQWVFTAGTETWKQCAARGIWVNGTFDGLGEEPIPFTHFTGKPVQWTKLTHDQSEETSAFAILPTYTLEPKPASIPTVPEYFWMSVSSFRRALELNPQILEAKHCSGPGHTAKSIEKITGRAVEVYLNFKHWSTGEPL